MKIIINKNNYGHKVQLQPFLGIMGKGADAKRKAKRAAKHGSSGGDHFETGRRKKPRRADDDYNSGKDNGGRARYEDFQREAPKRKRKDGEGPSHSRAHRQNSTAQLVRGPKGNESAKFARRREAEHERKRLGERAKMSRERLKRESEGRSFNGNFGGGAAVAFNTDEQRERAERKRVRGEARDTLCREITDLLDSFSTGEQVSTGQCNRALKGAVGLRDLLCAMTVWAGLQCGDIIAGSGDVEEVNGADDETYRQLASLHQRGSWKTLRHTSLGDEKNLFERAVALCGIAEGAVAQHQEGEGDLTTLDARTAQTLRTRLATIVKRRSIEVERSSLTSGSLLDTPHELAAEWIRANPATVEAAKNRFKLASLLAKQCRFSSKVARSVLAVMLKEAEVLKEVKKKFTVLQAEGEGQEG